MKLIKDEILNFLTRQRSSKNIDLQKCYKENIKFSDIRDGNLNGKPAKRICIILKSRGCGWVSRSSDKKLLGCTICSYALKTTMGGELSADEIMEGFYREYSTYNYKNYPIICLYNSGSFLNDAEIPGNVQLNIFKEVAKNKHIKQIVIESRAEYINEEKLKEIKEILNDKELVVGIGLESEDDYIRDVCINKGLSKEEYENAIKLVNKYFKSLTYILLKPPFINEHTAVIEATASIRYAFAAGSGSVSLEACNIQDFSLPYYLNEAGCYRPPWLWSIIRVINNCSHLGPISIGGFRITPMPRLAAHNCGRCDGEIADLMDQYNLYLDRGILNRAHCECKVAWETLMKEKLNSNQDIDKNIRNFLREAAG